MPELFGTNIAAVIGDALGPGLLEATLERATQGARDPDNLTAGPVAGTPLTSTGRGFFEDFETKDIDGTTITRDHRKAVLLGATFTLVPQQGDKLTMEGVTVPILRVLSRDPAAATYTVMVMRG